MSKYIKIQPEVIVGLGERTIFKELEPPFITLENLQIELEDWLGDDLMECFPAYIVTKNLKEALEKSKFSGFEFKKMEVSKAEYFEDNYQLDIELPKFYWMVAVGAFGNGDVVLSSKDELFISERLLNFLKEKFITKIMDIDPEQDSEQEDILKKLLERAKSRLK